MRSRFAYLIVGLILVGWLPAACSAPAATTEPDRVATRVAEELAVAATLTAAAPPPPVTQPPPTKPPEPTAPLPATDTLVPTQPPPPPPPPSPTATPDLDRVIPGAGTTKGLVGVIALPGYNGPLEEPLIFQDRIAFHLQVYDPGTGSQENGAGIRSVDFFITDPNGETVQQRTEQNPKYCVFAGGEPTCNVWGFAEHGNTWPNGQAVINDVCCYNANMVVHTQDPDKDEANWLFDFIVRLP